MVAAIAGQAVPRRKVVETHAVGLLFVARRTPVEVRKRRPIVADAEAQVVVVELGGRLTDDACGLDAAGLIERSEACWGYAVAEVMLHAANGVGDLRWEVDLFRLLYGWAVAAFDDNTLVIGALLLCAQRGGKNKQGGYSEYLFHGNQSLMSITISSSSCCGAGCSAATMASSFWRATPTRSSPS